MHWIREHKQGCTIEVHAQPQSKKNEIIGLHNDRLKIKIKSPPVDGKANECLTEFLAEILGINRSAVSVLRGETSRQKQILILNRTVAQVEPLLLKRVTT